MVYVHTMKFSKPKKKWHFVTCYITWMNLENTMFRAISQTQKDKYCRFHLHEVPRIGKFIETENRIEVSKSWWEG